MSQFTDPILNLRQARIESLVNKYALDPVHRGHFRHLFNAMHCYSCGAPPEKCPNMVDFMPHDPTNYRCGQSRDLLIIRRERYHFLYSLCGECYGPGRVPLPKTQHRVEMKLRFNAGTLVSLNGEPLKS